MGRLVPALALVGFGAAIATLLFALTGNSGTERGLKSTMHVYEGAFTTRIGDVDSQVVSCGSGQTAIGGGYLGDRGSIRPATAPRAPRAPRARSGLRAVRASSRSP
jgi:hypothetical protein